MRTQKFKDEYTSEDEKTQLELEGTLPQRRGKRTYSEAAHLLELGGNVE